MIEITVNTHELTDLSQRYAGAQPIVTEELGRGMTTAVNLVVASERTLAPSFSGRLRSSMKGVVQTQPGMVEGRAGSDLPYAIYVDRGRGAGKQPPISALTAWAAAHGIPVYVLARAIGKRGTKAKPFLQPALDATRSQIEQELGSKTIQRILARLSK